MSQNIKVSTSQKREEGEALAESRRVEVPVTPLIALSWQQAGWKKVSRGAKQEGQVVLAVLFMLQLPFNPCCLRKLDQPEGEKYP